ncbi:right-handed parallel beta-helix repeat-containing protein [Thalassotalea litorea]|nr:right-handed parallel beta-helix repeat-containing protein [Thalassotalea litorea]
MLKRINTNVVICLLLCITANRVFAADCNSVPVNPNGDTNKLRDALQQATNTGLSLEISGTYYIDTDLKVYLKKDLIVDATGAKFIATSSLDGDMFSFDAHNSKSDECDSAATLVDLDWQGGDFNMAEAKVSTVVPIRSRTPAGREGTKATADALSIRGVKANGDNKLNDVKIENIVFTGTKNTTDAFDRAGGDSGILLIGGLKVDIKNNRFYGVRDAAIYVSAGGVNGEFGDHFTIHNNYVERAYDGITSKRGADNIKMLNNTMQDVVVGLSIKRVYDGWTSTNVTISNNHITAAVRPVSVERANNVTIEHNQILALGAEVANQSTAINKYGVHYEGIALNGVQGSNTIRYNTINGITGSSREGITTTYGIVTRFEDGRETTGVTITDNTFSRLDKWVNHF